MCEYSMTSDTTKNYSIYATREYTTTNDEKYLIYATREYTTILNLHDAYYSLLERYMKHVFVADNGRFFFFFLIAPKRLVFQELGYFFLNGPKTSLAG